MNLINTLARKNILELNPYSSARHESTQKGIHLDANENPFTKKNNLNRYPDPQPNELRRRLSKIYQVHPSQILITRGSDEGIDLLVRTFCEAGKDSIVITPPTYGMYEVAANIQGAQVKSIPLIEETFELDIKSLLQQWLPSMKLIFLCSPNNPTGNILNKTDIFKLCNEFQNKALIVIDEAYIEFSKTESLSQYLSQHPNLVILRTLSKAYGLAGIRLGSLLASAEMITLLKKIIAPYPIPTPVSQISMEALSIKNENKILSQIKYIQEEREKLKIFLESLPSVEKVYPSEANFLLLKAMDAKKFMSQCLDNNIVIRSRHTIPTLQNCVRITIGTKEENQCLKKVLSYV